MSVRSHKVEVKPQLHQLFLIIDLIYVLYLLWTLLQPVKGQTLLTSSKTKQDVKPSLVSPPSSIMESRSLSLSPKTSRRVASLAEDIQSAHRERTKISSSNCDKWTGNFIFMLELRRKILTFRGIINLPHLTGYLSIINVSLRGIIFYQEELIRRYFVASSYIFCAYW